MPIAAKVNREDAFSGEPATVYSLPRPDLKAVRSQGLTPLLCSDHVLIATATVDQACQCGQLGRPRLQHAHHAPPVPTLPVPRPIRRYLQV